MKKTCSVSSGGRTEARTGLRLAMLSMVVVIHAGSLSARPPATRSANRLIWNPVKQKVVLFGGSTPADSSRRRTYMNDVWEWDTSRWVQVHPANPPAGRSGHAMVWDSVQNRMLVFGGIRGFDEDNNALVLGDTVALEDTEVCVIPYERLEEVASAMPVLRSHFHKVMSREIVREHARTTRGRPSA